MVNGSTSTAAGMSETTTRPPRRHRRGWAVLAAATAALAVLAGLVALAALTSTADDSDIAIATVRQHMITLTGADPSDIGCTADGPADFGGSQWRCAASVPEVTDNEQLVVVVEDGTGRVVNN